MSVTRALGFFPFPPRQLSCCGVQNYTNWSTSPYFLEHGIPPSCCMNDTDCNPQDLHNLTVAAAKVNQKVGVLSALMGSVVKVLGGGGGGFWCVCFCETVTNGLETAV